MEEKIKLSELLNICLSCKYDSNNQQHFQDLQTLLGKMQIRQYLPLIDKELAILSIISASEQGSDFSDSEMRLEIGKIIFGLFGYLTNFENDISFEGLTYSVIDSLYELDVIDHILEFCKKDYERLEKMLYNMMNFSNIEKIAKISEALSTDKLDAVASSLKNLKKDLTPEMLEAVKTISTDTSPEWKDAQAMFKEILMKNLEEKEFETLGEKKESKKEEIEDIKDIKA